MIEEKKHVEYMVLGFEQPFSGNLLNYHLLKCLEDGKKIHEIKQFLIDKVPNLFDTIQIRDDGLLNSFIKIKENPDLPKKMFDFLGQFDTLEKKVNDIKDLKENQKKELDDSLTLNAISELVYHQQLSEIETSFINKKIFEDCVIEGLVTMCSEKLTQIRCGKLGYKIYHHELVKPMGIPVVSGDIVRVYGRMDTVKQTVSAAMYGVKKYIPEVKAEPKKEDVKKEEPKKDNQKKEESEGKPINKGLDECEETQVPPPNSQNSSGSKGGSRGIRTKNNYELSAEGLFPLANKIIDDLK